MKLLRRALLAAQLFQLTTVAADGLVINTPAPMLNPTFGSCEQFHLAGPGEDCNALIAFSGLPRSEFFRINPGIGGEDHCADRIIPETWYCVRARAHEPVPPPAYQIPHHELPQATKTEAPAPQPTKTEPPEMTAGPKAPRNCAFGDCWVEFARLSFEGEDVQRHAAEMCTSLFNYGCQDHGTLDFPEGVKKGCKNCEELSSGCPCFTESKYHTYTNLRIFHPDWTRPGGPHDFQP